MSFLSGFLRNTSGHVALLFGLAAVPLMIAAGVAIDMMRISQTRIILQNAADSAAIAGAVAKDKSDQALEQKVREFLNANNAIDAMEYVTEIDQILDKDQGTFTVTIGGTIPGSFTSLF